MWLAALPGALALYLSTMAPGLLWGDSGYAQLHVALRGWVVDNEIVRSHVVYYALARGLAWASPLGPAQAANLVSAVCGAVTVANLAWLCARFCRAYAAVFCGTMLLMFSHTLWRLSTSAEVVTLTTALLTAELICCVRFVDGRRLRWLAAAMLVNGIGVSNHNFALLMWPVYIAAAVVWRRHLPRPLGRTALAACGPLLLGLIPILVLCVDDLLAHGSLRHTLSSLLLGTFREKLANVRNLGTYTLRSAGSLLLNFPTPLLFLAVPGVAALRRNAPGPIFVLLAGGAAIYAAFGIRYRVPDQHMFLVPAYLFVALFMAAGVEWLLAHVGAGRHGAAARLAACVLALPGPLVYAVVPPLLRTYAPYRAPIPTRSVPYRDRFNWFLRPWMTGYDGAERFAREVLASLPQDAWLVVDSTLLPPINFLQVAEGVRKDVRLDCWVTRQDWFPADELPAARAEKLRAGLLFTASDDPSYLPPWLRETPSRLEPAGHVFRVLPRE